MTGRPDAKPGTPKSPAASGILGNLTLRLRAFLGVKVLLGLCAAVGLSAWTLVVLDAAVVLPEATRASAIWVLTAAAAAVLAVGVFALVRMSPLRVARTFETKLPDTGTAMTNAVQLVGVSAAAPTAEVLRRDAVVYGCETARGLASWPVARRGVLVALAAAAAAMLLWLALAGLFPEVLEAVLPRFLDPHGDHPPWSRLKIAVEPGDTEVLYGGQCEIRATTSGAPAEKLYIVSENVKGRTQAVMFLRPDRSTMQTLTNLRETTRYWVTDGRARSRRFTIDIRLTPRITLVELTAAYPDYTKQRPTPRRKLEKTHLEVPKRTTLTFRVASNRPLSQGTLELVPLLGGKKRTVTLTREVDGDQVVSGGFEVTEAVAFEISVTDVDGLASRESRRGRVTVLPDRRPSIIVMEPGRHAVATPQISVPVDVESKDDYGVKHVLWFRGLNRSIERGFRMKTLDAGDPRSMRAQGAFNLADLGVKPGDRIEYFFEAVDNDPDGPNVTTSRMYTLQIISLAQYEQMLRQAAAQRALFQQYIQLNRHLMRTLERAQMLRRERRTLEKTKKPTAEQKRSLEKKARALRKAMDRYAKALDKALASRSLFDVEEEWKEHLRRQKRRLQKLTKDLDDMLDKANKPGGDGMIPLTELDKFLDNFEDMAGVMDRNVGKPAQHIAEVVKLLARANAFVQLTERQLRLAKIARRFEEKRETLSRIEQMELQEIAAEQRQIRDGLTRLMEEIPELVEKLPKDKEYDDFRESIEEFLQKVRDAEIQEDLDEATDRFAELKGDEGYPPAKSAGEKMAKIIEEMRADGSMQPARGNIPGRLVFKPVRVKGMGASISQILNAMMGGGFGGNGMGDMGMYGESLGLYGPDMELARNPLEDAGPPQGGVSAPEPGTSATDGTDPGLPRPKSPGRVRLQRNARFPLRYRVLVGDYLRAVAESMTE